DSLPPPIRSAFMDGLKKSVGAALGLNVLRDVLPNVGPDWGVCVLPTATLSSPGPADEGKTAQVDQAVWPQAVAALAVRPGDKKVDQALLKGVHLAAGALVFFYNQSHSDDPIQLKNTVQDKVEITYLANDKLFPRGVQPAFTLKDGYLIVASSPAAIAGFKA